MQESTAELYGIGELCLCLVSQFHNPSPYLVLILATGEAHDNIALIMEGLDPKDIVWRVVETFHPSYCSTSHTITGTKNVGMKISNVSQHSSPPTMLYMVLCHLYWDGIFLHEWEVILKNTTSSHKALRSICKYISRSDR